MTKFPIHYCIETSYLTTDMYNDLIRLLRRDGFVLPSRLDRDEKHYFWKYIGVNENGSIMLHDQARFYLPIESILSEELLNNILPEEWLWNYLKQ